MGTNLPAKPIGYAELLVALEERIRTARVRAALAVNSKLLMLYWQIGREILARQEEAGWGAKVIQQLADDLRREFPDMKGLSSRNLNYMRQLGEAWPEKFLTELGAGFAFVGSEVHLEVEGDDFYIDLLFYHLKLRCYVVIELKAMDFKPEYSGKLNFYLSAVDDLLRHPDDKPSIGLIILPERLKGQLPTIEELEAELSEVPGE